MKKIINIKEPDITNLEIRGVLECLKAKELSTYGKLVDSLSFDIKKINYCNYNVPVSSGSAALLLAFKSAGIQKDDIVITQSFTFGATTNSIINSGGKPWLFDFDINNFSIDLDVLEEVLKKKTYLKLGHFYHKKTHKKIFAICPVITFGVSPNLKRIKKIAKKFRLKIILDSACAFGTKFLGRSITDYADFSIFSFNGNKTITSGGGGILSTNNKNLFLKAKIISQNGKSLIRHPYYYDEVGFNFKMTNLHAAILKVQLKRFTVIKHRLKKIENLYKSKVSNNHFKFVSTPCSSDHVLWLNFVLCNSSKTAKSLIKLLRKKNVRTSSFWVPMHLQKIKKLFLIENMKLTNNFYQKIVILPSSSFLKNNQIKKIIKILNDFKK
jgi:perosamine synthetase